MAPGTRTVQVWSGNRVKAEHFLPHPPLQTEEMALERLKVNVTCFIDKYDPLRIPVVD